MSTIELIKQELRAMPFKEFEAKLELYTNLKSKGVRDEIMLSLCEAEMERRILAWEVAEV